MLLSANWCLHSSSFFLRDHFVAPASDWHCPVLSLNSISSCFPMWLYPIWGISESLWGEARGWRPLCQWCYDWKGDRVHTSPLGTYVYVRVPTGIQAQPHSSTWGQGAAAASDPSGYQIWTTPNTLSLPGVCLKS